MYRTKKLLNGQGGFTLIEMLIVVAIIAILVAVSIPMVTNNLEKANNATDAANVRAAKAAAVLDYLKDSGAVFTKTSKNHKYDAATGTFPSSGTITAYGKSKANPTNPDDGAEGVPETKVVEIYLDENGIFQKASWVAP